IVLPESVASIGDWTFGHCYSLAGFTIPNSITRIADYAFDSCTGLTNLTIPASVTGVGRQAFAHCTALAAISVDTLNPFFCSADGVLFDKNKTTVFQCPGGKAGSYTIPSGVTRIEQYAFEDCTSLTRVTLPASLTTIMDYAFYNCCSLTGVHFLGNAPDFAGVSVFFYDNDATVYYLPGTTGWDTTFQG